MDQTCGAAANRPGRWTTFWTGTREEQHVKSGFLRKAKADVAETAGQDTCRRDR